MKKILLLEDNLELCKLLGQIFNSFGTIDLSICHSYSDVTALNGKALNFEVAFLDVNLGMGQKTGIDAFDWLLENGYQGKTVFFTGHASSYGVLKKITDRPNVYLLDKPADISKIREHIFN